MNPLTSVIYKASEVFTRVLTSTRAAKVPLFNSVYSLTYFFIKGVLESKEYRYFESVVKPGMIVVDVGANLGFFTLLFSKLVGPAGKVYACEPDPFIFSLLQRNLAKRKLRNVIALNIAVSDSEKKLTLYVNEKNRADNRIYASPDSERRTVTVSAKPLDAIIPPGEIVDFIKMDIQGAEFQAVNGMKGLFSRSIRCVLFTEFWPYGLKLCASDAEAYLRFLVQRFTVSDFMTSQKIGEEDIASYSKGFPQDDFGYSNLICSPR